MNRLALLLAGLALAAASIPPAHAESLRVPETADRPLDVSFERVRDGAARTPEGRERVWSAWERSASAIERRVRANALPAHLAPIAEETGRALEDELVARGVAPDPHGWPAGCKGFGEALAFDLERALDLRRLESWLDWLAVFRVTCPTEATEPMEPLWDTLWAGKLDALKGWSLAPFLAAVPEADARATFLAPLPTTQRQCMQQELPEALRMGFDRHEGLRHVAHECGLSPEAMFGGAVRCADCGPHPRRRPSRMREALVGQPVLPAAPAPRHGPSLGFVAP